MAEKIIDVPGLISVIIPAYNQGQYLAAALDSLIAQTYPRWEAIVIDDGSPDDSAQIAQAYMQRDARVKLVRQSNGGTSAAKNNGLQHAAGEFIQFLDCDDVLAPHKFANAMEIFTRSASIAFVYSNVRYFDDGSDQLRYSLSDNTPWVTEFSGNSANLLPKLTEGNLFTINMPIFKRQLLQKTGVYMTNLRGAEDWDLWFRMAALGIEMVYDPAPQSWALVRAHPQSASRNTDFMRRSSLIVRQRIAATLASLERTDLQMTNYRLMMRDRRTLLRSYLQQRKILPALQQVVFLLPYAVSWIVTKLIHKIKNL